MTSKNLVTKKLIETILNKYIKNEECFIQDLNDIYIISYYLYHHKYLQNFIKLNQLQIRDFIYLITSSKIIYGNDDSLIFREGETSIGAYILIKGGIMTKISKLSLPDKLDSFFKREILQEYNLDKNNDDITWFDIKKDNKKEENKNEEEIKCKFLSKCKMTNFSPYSSIFQQKHEERLKLSKRFSTMSSNMNDLNGEKRKLSIIMNEQIDLFKYNINKDDILCFGSVNIFNEYLREEKQIHLTSAYLLNKDNENHIYNFDEVNNILLYIQEDNIKGIEKKISLINKERIKFLKNILTPLNQIISPFKKYFISTIKLIYINIENQKEIIIKNHIFYLVYKGACCEKRQKEIIYDKGSFIGLNNLFLNKNSKSKDTITINSKGAEAILFKIDLNVLSQNNQIKMIKYLAEIFTKQYFVRQIYMNEIISYENKKIRQKEKLLDDEIKEYLLAHGINYLHRTDREAIDKKFQINENNNVKCLNNIYINNKNIFKLLSKSEEQKKEISKNEISNYKNKTYFVKGLENSNSSSPRTSRSSSTTLPFLSQTQKSKKSLNNLLINIDQNPINIITLKKNYISGKKSSKNIISRNESNNLKGITSISSFNSIYYLSQYDKSLSRAVCKKKNVINKNILLKNFNHYRNQGKNNFHLKTGKSH